MKGSLFLVWLIIFSVSISSAQQMIPPEEASKHVGDSVSVCGKVYGGIYLDKTASKLTLLNIGGAHPDAPFTVVLPSTLRHSIGIRPEKDYRNKNMCFTGRVELYKEKPQMVINRSSQMMGEMKL